MKTKTQKYKVTVRDPRGEKSTRVLINMTKEDEYGNLPEEYDGHHHNYDGPKGVAINRAIKKLYGSDAVWRGQCDCLYHGQVLGAGGYSKTCNVTIDIVEGW